MNAMPEPRLLLVRTNCPQYLIETARGHRDAAHEEPLVLRGGSGPADLCFLPRPGAFTVQADGLPPDSPPLRLLDDQGVLRAELPRDSTGTVSARIPEDPERGTEPWRLQMAVPRGQVRIDGLTRWDARDLYPDLCLWTARPEAFFPLQPCRWLQTP